MCTSSARGNSISKPDRPALITPADVSRRSPDVFRLSAIISAVTSAPAPKTMINDRGIARKKVKNIDMSNTAPFDGYELTFDAQRLRLWKNSRMDSTASVHTTEAEDRLKYTDETLSRAIFCMTRSSSPETMFPTPSKPPTRSKADLR